MKALMWIMPAMMFLGGSLLPAMGTDETALNPHGKVIWTVAPMAGWDRNKLKTPTGDETDTGPEYGIFALMAHPNFVVNNFAFWADVNDTDIFGDLLFANYYMNSTADLTWNFGAGYLYHKIEPQEGPLQQITVNAPMIKTGPRFRIRPLHLTVNPYIGYEWEEVRFSWDFSGMPMGGPAGAGAPAPAPSNGNDNNSFLYGLSLSWHWRMMEGAVNYYYQDSQDLEPDEDFQVLRARLNMFFTKTWGLAARVDYMEHQTTDDTSFLIGPTVVW